MKVLLVITKSEIGGAQNFVLNLAHSLTRMGITVEVAAGEGDYLFNELSKYEIPFHYLRSLKRNFSILNSYSFIHNLYILLKSNNYDILHLNSSNTLFGVISARILKNRPKIVFTFHGLSFLDKNFHIGSFLRPFAKLYYKIFLKMVDTPVFVSQKNYDDSKKSNIIKQGKIIYNGLNQNEMTFFSKSEARKYFSINFNINCIDKYIIGSVGRLAYQKNYDFIINNFSLIKEKIPECTVIIIGDGKDFRKLNDKIRELGHQEDIFLVGAIKDSYKYIKAFDLFTLPSRYEGLSISLIEAVFAGIPILASDVGGNSEIVDSHQLFKLYDINDYLDKLSALYNMSYKINDINNNIENRFSLEKMVSEYKELYESLHKNSL